MTSPGPAPRRTARAACRATFAAAAAAAVLLALPAAGADPALRTPRAALHLFIDAAREGDYATAALALDLGAIPPAARAAEGPRLARELKAVLDERLWIDWDRISDAPEGDPADGPGVDLVGTLPLGTVRVPVRLVRDASGDWRLGPGIVAAVPRLYAAHGRHWLADRIPEGWPRARFLEVEAWQWLGLLAALALAAGAAIALGGAARGVALRLARRTAARWDDLLVDALSTPLRLLLGTAALAALARSLALAAPAQGAVDRVVSVLAVSGLAFAALRLVRFGFLAAERRAAGSDGAARARLTQLAILRRVATVAVVVVGAAVVLLQFDSLRALGTSVLASAGVAGIVVGFAAQRSLGALLAGLQVSFTQPVRIGDVVVMEGEWGTIEEITLTYVVLHIWDDRRLVIPMTRVLDAPIENWTRAGTAILGTVFVQADYRVPVERVRAELARFVETRTEWDRRAVGLQVTGASDRTVELRALVSSADSSASWDLRCAVREHLVGFLQRLDGGAYLPRARLEARTAAPRNEAVAIRPDEWTPA